MAEGFSSAFSSKKTTSALSGPSNPLPSKNYKSQSQSQSQPDYSGQAVGATIRSGANEIAQKQYNEQKMKQDAIDIGNATETATGGGPGGAGRPATYEEKRRYEIEQTGVKNIPLVGGIISEGATQIATGGHMIREGTPIEKAEGVGRIAYAGVSGASAGYAVGTAIGVGGLAMRGGSAVLAGEAGLAQTNFEAGKNVLITSGKNFGMFQAFDTGLELATTGKVSKSISRENIERNYLIGVGTSGIMNTLSPTIMKTGEGIIKTGAVEGGLAGGLIGGQIAVHEKESGKLGQYVSTGAVIGGGLGAGAGWLESKSIKPVVGLAEYRVVNEQSGKTADLVKGFKIGIEKVNPKTGKGEFKGLDISTKPKIGENEVITPKGILEQGKMPNNEIYDKELSRDFGKDFFKKEEISHKTVEQNIKTVAGKDSKNLMEQFKKSDASIGGSTVERAIPGKSEVNPRFQAKPGDIDVVFHSSSDFSTFQKGTSDFVKFTKVKQQNLQGAPENLYIEKYTGKLKSGGGLDISIVHPSLGLPKPASPYSQYMDLGTFQRGPRLTTYSKGQQLGTKFMTVGQNAKGFIRPIEAVKSKYIMDVASFSSKSAKQTIAKAKHIVGPDYKIEYKGMPKTIFGSRTTVSGVPSFSSSVGKKSSFKSGSSSSSIKPSISPSSSLPSVSPSSSLPSFSSSSGGSSSGSSGTSSGSSSSMRSSSPPSIPKSSGSYNFNYNFNSVPALSLLPLGGGGGSPGGRGKSIKPAISKQLRNLKQVFRI